MNFKREALTKTLSFVIRSGMDEVELNDMMPFLDDRPAMPEYGDHSLIVTSSQKEIDDRTTEKKMINNNNAAFFIR